MKTRLSLLVLLIALLVAIACGTTAPNLEATQVAQDKATMEALATTIARQQETQRTPSATPSDASTPADAPVPAVDEQLAFGEVARNADWTPVIREFNGVPMVLVPAGCFTMGSEDGGPGENPAHEVCLSPFWIGQTEVTIAQYRACVDAGACDLPSGSGTGFVREHFDDPAHANHPVLHVAFNEADTYAWWWGGSLPTEAQWEYAARGPEGWTYPWGDAVRTCQFANTSGCGGETAPVGPDQRPFGASWVGALDMCGNVWEWVTDYYDQEYYGTLEDGVLDPTGPDTGTYHVLRGGSYLRSLHPAWRRVSYSPSGPNTLYGLRVVRPFTKSSP